MIHKVSIRLYTAMQISHGVMCKSSVTPSLDGNSTYNINGTCGLHILTNIIYVLREPARLLNAMQDTTTDD